MAAQLVKSMQGCGIKGKFKLLAPQEEKRIGTFVIIQEDGSDKWGIISKNHIRNFFRVFPEE